MIIPTLVRGIIICLNFLLDHESSQATLVGKECSWYKTECLIRCCEFVVTEDDCEQGWISDAKPTSTSQSLQGQRSGGDVKWAETLLVNIFCMDKTPLDIVVSSKSRRQRERALLQSRNCVRTRKWVSTYPIFWKL
jgi:hypothetical protein